MNFDNRNNLGGEPSERYKEFEQDRTVPRSSLIPDQTSGTQSTTGLKIYNEIIPEEELDNVDNIGRIYAQLYRDALPDS